MKTIQFFTAIAFLGNSTAVLAEKKILDHVVEPATAQDGRSLDMGKQLSDCLEYVSKEAFNNHKLGSTWAAELVRTKRTDEMRNEVASGISKCWKDFANDPSVTKKDRADILSEFAKNFTYGIDGHLPRIFVNVNDKSLANGIKKAQEHLAATANKNSENGDLFSAYVNYRQLIHLERLNPGFVEKEADIKNIALFRKLDAPKQRIRTSWVPRPESYGYNTMSSEKIIQNIRPNTRQLLDAALTMPLPNGQFQQTARDLERYMKSKYGVSMFINENVSDKISDEDLQKYIRELGSRKKTNRDER